MPGRVVIVGGGLAGMMVAKELAVRSVAVEILEAAERLGGKAGANLVDGRREDHGFHFFPGWYANTRALLSEIGVASHLIDLRAFHQVRRGEWPQTIEVREPATITAFLHNLFAGALPWHENILFIYSVLDLAAESFHERAYLDRVSGIGFLRSRFYATEGLARFQHHAVLQASSIPFHDLSAMTMRRLVRYWMQTPSPFMSLLDGDLQTRFIEPFERYLVDLGVVVRKRSAVERLVVENERVRGVVLQNGARLDVDGDDVVLAVPHHVAHELASPGVILREMAQTDPEHAERDGLADLGDLANLRSTPMAALHLHLARHVPSLPREHVILLGSRVNASFIDVGRHWGLDHSAIQVIASNFEPLRHLEPELIKQVIVEELLEYVPDVRREDLPADLGFLQTHIDEPLFLNTVGAWASRPGPRTTLPNLFVAGDYCRSQADLTTMESAVLSGISAAAAILARAGVEALPQAIDLAEPSDFLLQAVRWGALPLVAPLALMARAREAFRDLWSR